MKAFVLQLVVEIIIMACLMFMNQLHQSFITVIPIVIVLILINADFTKVMLKEVIIQVM